ncbi:uncharacterized protein BX663DRAFT_508565 [Cokeromyces recurvatus]|uniref:uncharacterized protein n=1 Tax=Cokeromyces recurvatus TaxID=90255 RepID=UPI00221F99A5|nr:uncharacterized protein BX663DRAFT_508565 [Cokeromyces recurvatus]KAI7902827.1 hypothetical protein BX663DRAFT_508565 [Cokeromyces recurvatus]
MLRPSKIFVSFHQLRHFLQTKISELVTISNHPSSSQQITDLFPTISQQAVYGFSNIHRTLLQQNNFQATVQWSMSANEKTLLKLIQHRFPIVKVFSSPTLHRRIGVTSSIGRQQQQFRTMMMSSSSSAPGSVPTTLFTTWGFSRTTNIGRTPAFARQFSTTKHPYANLFQNTANPMANGQSNPIFTRIFSSAGNKMNQQSDLNEKQQTQSFKTSSLFYSLSNSSIDEESSDSAYIQSYYNRIFASTQVEECMIKQEEDENMKANNNNTSNLLIQQNQPVSCSTEKTHYCHMNNQPLLESILHHDDLSSLHNNDITNNKLYITDTKHSVKPNPHHVEKMNDQLLPLTASIKNKEVQHDKSTSVYILITLDTLQFLNNNHHDWSTQSLTSSFIDGIEAMAYEYQIHINYVLKLLDNLQRHGKFRVVARQGELRIYFPVPSPRSKEKAFQFLYSYNMIDPIYEKRKYFSIIVEDHESPSLQDFKDHFYVEDLSSITVGPDYFKDLQLFLDHTDYLIETSSNFASNHHSVI